MYNVQIWGAWPPRDALHPSVTSHGCIRMMRLCHAGPTLWYPSQLTSRLGKYIMDHPGVDHRTSQSCLTRMTHQKRNMKVEQKTNINKTDFETKSILHNTKRISKLTEATHLPLDHSAPFRPLYRKATSELAYRPGIVGTENTREIPNWSEQLQRCQQWHFARELCLRGSGTHRI